MKNTLENPKLGFLSSPRFWVMIAGAIGIYLEAKGFIGEAERNLIGTIAAGFITIKTLDRNTGDAKVEAAKITK